MQPGDYQGARREHKDQIKKEFASYLHDVSLQSDNVSAVLKVCLSLPARFYLIEMSSS